MVKEFVLAVFSHIGRSRNREVVEAEDQSVGELNGRLVAVVWMQRGETIRIITMGRARYEEQKRYRALYG